MDSSNLILLNGRTPWDYPAQFTYVSTTGCSVIDLVWTNLDGCNLIKDLSVELLSTCSDHLPIVRSLDVMPSVFPCNFSATTTLRWKLQETGMLFHLPTMPPPPDCALSGLSVTDFPLILKERITLISRTLGMQSRPIAPSSLPTNIWFDSDCGGAKRLLSHAFRSCKKFAFSSPYLETFLDYKIKYKALLKEKKTTYTSALIDNLNTCKDSSTFWSIINKFRKHPVTPNVVEPKLCTIIYNRRTPPDPLFLLSLHFLRKMST